MGVVKNLPVLTTASLQNFLGDFLLNSHHHHHHHPTQLFFFLSISSQKSTSRDPKWLEICFFGGFSNCQISTVFFIKYRQIFPFDSSMWPEMARNLFFWGGGGFYLPNFHSFLILNIDWFLYLILAYDQKWLEICLFGGFLVAKCPQFFFIKYPQISLFDSSM